MIISFIFNERLHVLCSRRDALAFNGAKSKWLECYIVLLFIMSCVGINTETDKNHRLQILCINKVLYRVKLTLKHKTEWNFLGDKIFKEKHTDWSELLLVWIPNFQVKVCTWNVNFKFEKECKCKMHSWALWPSYVN